MSVEMTYRDIPEYTTISQGDRDAIDAFIGGAQIPVDDATFERIVFGNEPDWRALALEAGKALEPVVALLQRHNDSQRDTSPVFAVNDAELTFGDLRRATHALAAIKAVGSL